MKAVEKFLDYIFKSGEKNNQDKNIKNSEDSQVQDHLIPKFNKDYENEDIPSIDINQVGFDKQAPEMLSSNIVRQLLILPFKYRNDELYIAISSKSELYKLEKIYPLVACRIKPFLTDKRSIQVQVNIHYPTKGNIYDKDVDKLKNDTISDESDSKNIIKTKTLLEDDAEKYIGSIIIKAIRNNATDVHIEKLYDKNASIRYRVNGKLVHDPNELVIDFDMLSSKIKLIAQFFSVEKVEPQKSQAYHLTSDRVKIPYTVLLLPMIDGEKFLFKLPHRKSEIKYDELGLLQNEKDYIQEMFSKKSGLIIVTGIPGNGRTTTLYGLLKKYSTRENFVISVEKNINLKLNGVVQIETSSSDNQNFNESKMFDIINEHDADIIAVDIDLDSELTKKLIKIALSGKKVIITLPFPTIYDALIGLASMNIEPYILALVIEGVIAQYLVGKSCECKKDSQVGIVEKKKNTCAICSDPKYNNKTCIFEVFKKEHEHWRYLQNISDFEQLKIKLSESESTFEKNSEKLVDTGVTTQNELLKVGLGKKSK